jgi:Domain of unknown function (DUF1835)
MLHITNGDIAATLIAEAGVGGDVLPWRDVLHEGPIPEGLTLDELRPVRARFIAEQGWGEFDDVLQQFAWRDATLGTSRRHDEVVLWFEHDLYDQLQLIQLLDWFNEPGAAVVRLSAVFVDEYLGTLTRERLRILFHQRTPVTGEQLLLGATAWRAFASGDPERVERLARGDCSALRFLADALRRHLEQFPSVHNGLSRSEMQTLEAIAGGRRVLRDAFVAANDEREERIFLGDAVFARYVERLSAGRVPLLRLEAGGSIVAPRTPEHGRGFWEARVELTLAGHAVLEGRMDWLEISGIDRWLGGVHLFGRDARWRWDGAARQLQRRDA